MTKRNLMLALAVPALLLGGCGTVNRGLESVHQPVVERNDYVFDVATSGNALASGEAQRLAGWLGSLRLGYGDRIAIDDPAGRAGGVQDAVAAEAARFGMLLSDQAPLTQGMIAPGTARVVVSRTRASVPSCPDNSRVSGVDPNANTWSNMGCAVNTNLAAMVARPEDLVRGQPGAESSDAATAFKAIDALRNAKPGANPLPAVSSRGR